MSEKKVDESWKEKVAQEQATASQEQATASQEQAPASQEQAPASQEQQVSSQEDTADSNTASGEDVKTEAENFEMPPVDFNLFISSLGMQTLMALGDLENPMNGKKEKQLPQAKYLIDTLEMLQLKTKGNLDTQEANVLEQMLYELRMKYIALSKDK